ncbi:phosphoenolpyruvate-protein phosphotransferase [Clostridia bacterium]|nr:phosphoenolpyruvate-protein phosphotransferase [Clostridia bacterium]
MIGTATATGKAMGKILIIRDNSLDFTKRVSLGAEEEILRLERAIGSAGESLQRIFEEISSRSGEEEAGIFEYQILVLQDEDFVSKITDEISLGSSCEIAVDQITHEYMELFANMDNDYLKQRVIDIDDLRIRLLGILAEDNEAGAESAEAIVESVSESSMRIIAARNLTPSKVAEIDLDRVKGILLENGGKSSHSVILARSLGISCITGLEGLLDGVKDGDCAYMDGATGELIICDSPETESICAAKVADFQEQKAALNAYIDSEAVTVDGEKLQVLANAASQQEIQLMLANGGGGIGLFRTEFIFSAADKAPSEEVQFELYSQMAKTAGELPIIFRTLDAGGDKVIDYLRIEKEDNPFLGYRAIRYCLDHPEILRRQLAAILRASCFGNIKLMFPMIATVDELDAAISILNETKQELDARGLAYGNIETGMMVETPAAGIMAETFAKKVDFFSIGTNDLIQYVFAADRGNKKLAHLNSASHPALLRFVNDICKAGLAEGIEVDICGQAGEVPELIPIWIAMGIRTLSVSVSSIPLVKKIICGTNCALAEEALKTVLSMESAAEVERFLGIFYKDQAGIVSEVQSLYFPNLPKGESRNKLVI